MRHVTELKYILLRRKENSDLPALSTLSVPLTVPEQKR